MKKPEKFAEEEEAAASGAKIRRAKGTKMPPFPKGKPPAKMPHMKLKTPKARKGK